jgi:hypothetical protein
MQDFTRRFSELEFKQISFTDIASPANKPSKEQT